MTVGYDVEEGQDVSFVSIILISVTEKEIAVIKELQYYYSSLQNIYCASTLDQTLGIWQ